MDASIRFEEEQSRPEVCHLASNQLNVFKRYFRTPVEVLPTLCASYTALRPSTHRVSFKFKPGHVALFADPPSLAFLVADSLALGALTAIENWFVFLYLHCFSMHSPYDQWWTNAQVSRRSR